MSSSSFSFSSDDGEDGREVAGRDSSAAEGRLVVVAPRDLISQKNDEEVRGKDEDEDDDRRRRKQKRKRKKHQRKRHEDDHDSDSYDDSGDKDRRRRRRPRRKKRKRESKKDRKDSRRWRRHDDDDNNGDQRRSDTKMRQQGDVDGEPVSRALVVVEKDTASSKVDATTNDHEGTRERQLPRPSTSRSFATVSKSVNDIQPQKPKHLMIEDGRVENDGTRCQDVGKMPDEDEQIDMVQAYREYISCNATDEEDKQRVFKRQLLLLPMDYEDVKCKESELSEKYMKRQKLLNEMVKSNPNDEDAWIALANLHQPQQHCGAAATAAALQSKRREVNEKKEIAGLERKREILTRAVRNNLDSIALRVALIGTLERLCLLSIIEEKEVEAENDNAIRFFEVLAAEELSHRTERRKIAQAAPAAVSNQSTATSKILPQSLQYSGPTRLQDLIRLHRLRLRRLPSTKGSRFTANRMRESYIEAFCSVSKVHGEGDALESDMSVLFLDYIRMEALLGYSERAVAMIQAALEMNLLRHATRSDDGEWEESFFAYWNSEAPRIGDAYPGAGWLEWKERKQKSATESSATAHESAKNARKKMKRRLKASDFFFDEEAAAEDTSQNEAKQASKEIREDSSQSIEDRKQNLIGAYKSAASQPHGVTARKQDVEKIDQIFSVARSAVERQQERQQEEQLRSEQIGSGDEDDDISKESTTINVEGLTAQGGEVVLSQVKEDKASVVQVYSFVHNRRIEVSKDELSGEATKDSLQKTLKRLRKKKKDAIDGTSEKGTSAPKLSNGGAQLYIIRKEDGFLQWSTDEAKTQDLFSPPLRSTQEPEPSYYDHNRSIWLEDGIQWTVSPYLSKVGESRGISALVSVCLEFLGITFPRSLLFDLNEKGSYVLGSSGSGGERLIDMTCTSPGFQRALNGVFEAPTRDNAAFCWFDIYHQLLLDESIVSFDERLFQAGEEKQMGFVRNVLHDIVSRSEQELDVTRGPQWTAYMQVALIMFEARASGGKAAAVARGILSGTEAAKHDPRLWLSYAQLEYEIKCSTESADKAFRSITKVLISALEAADSYSFQGHYSIWWMELAVTAVRAMLRLPTGSRPSSTSNFARIDEDFRGRLLHIICCVVEGKFTALPKKSKKQQQVSKSEGATPLVDDARLRKCQLYLRSHLGRGKNEDIEALFTTHPSAEAFDCTPKAYYFAVLAAWMKALEPKNCTDGAISFDAGIAVLNEWMSNLIATQRTRGFKHRSGFNTCLVRLVHAKVELSMLSSLNQTATSVSASTLMMKTLVPSVVLLKKNTIIPSRSLVLAMAYAESQLSSQLVCGYEHLLCPYLAYELHSNEVAYLLAKAVFVANRMCMTVGVGDEDSNVKSIPDAECSRWTRDGRKAVEAAILFAVDKAGYCTYPPLWAALLRLKLLGSLASTRKPARAFSEIKAFYHDRALPRSSQSKSMWLDAFTLLRPIYSEVEMIYHMAAMEEKDIRLKKGLEAIMRMTGGQ